MQKTIDFLWWKVGHDWWRVSKMLYKNEKISENRLKNLGKNEEQWSTVSKILSLKFYWNAPHFWQVIAKLGGEIVRIVGLIYNSTFIWQRIPLNLQTIKLIRFLFPSWLINYIYVRGTTWTQEMVWCISNNVDLKAAKKSLIERFPFIE